ncbi:p-hydroxybenzoic acid efflux pump subunit AaeA [bacterium BMS3Bbin14]|nr:p-hydroxybenzoic acid efflux pump subunit AaeA [bacterium BMS3Abin13]GBE51910.1 p-hydroxybenzoic acid efflux pump subunit AaeA [bacterium BMS3Bbin14]HDK43632.1 efflux RND transporter periplasmic adaptor subunit [Desulfobacteraceae bacterium]
MKWVIFGLFIVFEFVGHPAMATGFAAAIHWARRVELSTPVSGVIKTVTVVPGALVKKGQVMLTLEPTPFKAALQRARAEEVRAAVARDEAKRDDDQAKQLYANTVLSTVELQNADNKYKRAQAGWSIADADVAQAEYRLTYSVIRAPFEGWVLQRNAEPGQTVSSRLAPPPLLIFVAAGRYVARVRVPGPQLDRVSVGQQVKVKIGGVGYSGTVESIGLEPVPAAADKESAYAVDVVFNVSKPLLRAGQRAEVDLP